MAKQQITQILEKSRVDGIFCSHVSLFSPKGKFQVNRQNIEPFWDAYCELIESNGVIGLGERPQHYLPILVDIDLKIKDDGKGGEPTKLYKEKHIRSVVEIYQSVLRTILRNCTDTQLTCFVLEKPPYRVECGSTTYLKNGFHLHFLVFLSKTDHEVHLIPRVQKLLKEANIFGDIFPPEIDQSKLIDVGYTKAFWLLYGSRKSDTMESYKLSKVIDAEGMDITLKEALASYAIFDADENVIELDGYEEYFLPRVFSIVPFNRPTSEVKVGLISPIKERFKKVLNKQNKVYKEISITEGLEKAKKLIHLISNSRADDRNDWIRVGWILHNIGEGCQEALDLWIEFSAKCPEKFNESVCVDEWNKMIRKNISMGTLKFYAKQDNPVEYQKYTDETSQKFIFESLNGSHNDIARALYEKYSTEFVCASISSKVWYQFENHHWELIEEGYSLREKISSELALKYAEIGSEAFKKCATVTNDAEKAMYNIQIKQSQKMVNSLKSAPYKQNVMKEACEVFYNKNFLKNLDKNQYLIGFQNGVYDLKKNEFRSGIPDDYISMQMPISYIEMSENDPRVRDTHDYLEKVFPDRSVREYFMDHASDIFVGGNQNKKVHFWSGDGDNAKSVTESIFEKMLGPYAIKAPTSLLIGKRGQSGSASPELVRAGHGVRLVFIQEPDKKDVVNVGILKELSGNDTFFARDLWQKGKETSEIEPMFKLAIICNDPPILPYNDKATWNRVRVIPFESTFCENAPKTFEEQLLEKRFPKDPYFNEKIGDMLQAFAWVLLNHRKKPLKHIEADRVRISTAEYRKKNDIYCQFIDEKIIQDKSGAINLAELYLTFKLWFKDSMPNHTVPIKNDMREYLTKAWGEAKSCIWNGKRMRTDKDDINDGLLIVLENEDLVDYGKQPKFSEAKLPKKHLPPI